MVRHFTRHTGLVDLHPKHYCLAPTATYSLTHLSNSSRQLQPVLPFLYRHLPQIQPSRATRWKIGQTIRGPALIGLMRIDNRPPIYEGTKFRNGFSPSSSLQKIPAKRMTSTSLRCLEGGSDGGLYGNATANER